mmetsp:Transcript_23242/g.50989  ORF Transcript_23242/g.50989 Transcript_23242/m.50989 type:complete len:90 (+) Transcript_23242:487-756(+)
MATAKRTPKISEADAMLMSLKSNEALQEAACSNRRAVAIAGASVGKAIRGATVGKAGSGAIVGSGAMVGQAAKLGSSTKAAAVVLATTI